MIALRLIAGGLLLSAAMLAGCNGGAQSQEPSGGAYREVSPPVELVGRARAPIADLPVPMGFNLDEGRSRNFAAAGARYVDHLYKGSADKFAVARFYKRQMPISRWVLVTDMFVQGEIVLDFEKETERCRAIIAKGDLFHGTYIKIQLWTSGRIQTPGAASSSGKAQPAK